MAGAISISIDNAAFAALAAAPDVLAQELTRAVLTGQMLIEREVKERTPTASGLLRDSIGAQPIELSGAAVTGSVGTASVYAEAVELGSRPHMPPLAPLTEWVKRKLGLRGDDAEAVARSIQWKIKAHGTPSAQMFEKALRATTPQIESIVAAAVQRALHRIGGAA